MSKKRKKPDPYYRDPSGLWLPDFLSRTKPIAERFMSRRRCCCPTGSCCVGETCSVTTEAACDAAGGTWTQGGDCDPNPCVPSANGGCCIDGECTWITESECESSGGTWLGEGVDCEDEPTTQCNPCSYCTGTNALYLSVTINQPQHGSCAPFIETYILTRGWSSSQCMWGLFIPHSVCGQYNPGITATMSYIPPGQPIRPNTYNFGVNWAYGAWYHTYGSTKPSCPSFNGTSLTLEPFYDDPDYQPTCSVTSFN